MNSRIFNTKWLNFILFIAVKHCAAVIRINGINYVQYISTLIVIVITLRNCFNCFKNRKFVIILLQ